MRAGNVLGRASNPPIPDFLAQGWAVYAIDYRTNPRYTLDPLEWEDTVIAVDKGKPVLVQTLPTLRGARTIGIDERTGQVFIPSAEYAAPVGGGRPAITPGSFKLLVVSP